MTTGRQCSISRRSKKRLPRSKQAAVGGSATAKRDDQRRIEALCAWFDHHARDLPWRQRRYRNGYGALVAEIMLQQTQVSRVIERYRHFMQQFPTVSALAAADQQAVLAQWQGMGYYRRAVLLHKAAQHVVDHCDGRVPIEAASLRTLPGVGRYTAGAIASIIFWRHEPIVDGNVQRVLARWHAKRQSPQAPAAKRWAWQTAERLVRQAERPGVFNEALMELGATICTPRSPRCEACPVAGTCMARKRSVQHVIPTPAARIQPRQVHHHAVMITRNGCTLLEQRSATGMWAGMWQTPTIEREHELSLEEIERSLPIGVHRLDKRASFQHTTTHRRIQFHVYRARARSPRGSWHALEELHRLPMSSAQRRVLAMAQDQAEIGLG